DDQMVAAAESEGAQEVIAGIGDRVFRRHAVDGARPRSDARPAEGRRDIRKARVHVMGDPARLDAASVRSMPAKTADNSIRANRCNAARPGADVALNIGVADVYE